jgi:carboxymethylenebutenolidase
MAELWEGPHPASVWHEVLDDEIEVIVATPDGPTVRAGIVIPLDIFGIRPVFDDLCRRLATHGYAVVGIDPFTRIDAARRVEMDLEARRVAVADLEDRVQIGDMRRAAAELRARFGLATVHALGFCMGGYYVLKAAATGEFAKGVSCYGMADTPPMWEGPNHRSPLATIDRVAPVLVVFGGRDHWTPPERIEPIRSALAHRDDCEVVIYPEADHGFVHDPTVAPHRPEDAADFWRRTLAFLDR